MRGAVHGRVRAASLIAGGALALHQLRYLLVYRQDAGQVLAGTGHHYLSVITPLVAGLLVLALHPFLALVGRGRSHGGDGGHSLGALWAMATGCLVAVYAAQEWLEGRIVEHHPEGASGVLGHGGWSALLLAAAIGLLVALAMRGARSAEPVVLGVAGLSPLPRPGPVPVRVLVQLVVPARDAVACFLVGRGPPPARAVSP